MRAARNERHIMSRRGQPPAEIASDGTRRHDRYPHSALLAARCICLARQLVLWTSEALHTARAINTLLGKY